MTDAVRTSFLHRIRHTPLRDVFRGHLSARLDWRARLAAASLAPRAGMLIERVVKRTRLWRIERAVVADELIAHFRDAAEADRPIDAVVGEFGDERRAARLIRRAKIRNRPLWWKACRWVCRSAIALILAYGLSYPIYYFSRPSPRIDYLAQINAPIERVPASDRGWPIYRRVLLAQLAQASPADRNSLRFAPVWLHDNVDGPHWPQMLAWLKEHRQDVQLLRAAAAKPSMGFLLGPDGSFYDSELFPFETPRLHQEWSDFPFILGVLLPHLSYAHSFSQILKDDAKLAQLNGDGPRLEADIQSILGIADQLRHDGQFGVTDLVADGIDKTALDAIERVLRTDPSALSDPQLIGLAHRLAGPRVAADITSLAGERIMFHDIVQHVYTDNGHGDGHLTPAGLQLLVQAYAEGAESREFGYHPISLSQAVGPANMFASVSRKDLLDQFDRLMDLAQANLSVPQRDADWKTSEQLLDKLNGSRWSLMRYGPVTAAIPDVRGRAITAEQYLARRDGIITAIALELYHRQNGTYPAGLQSLAPEFMPAVPIGPITGQPIEFRITDDKPVIYTRTVDAAGKPPAERWYFEYRSKLSGDEWILYPVPPYMD
jgi:hypothetical protein